MSGIAARILIIALPVLAVSGCSLGYYLHSARGQASLMSKRVPIAELVADPATPPKLRERLELVQRARSFASDQLGLPDRKGYRTYADLERPFAVWNVVATPEFSLQPRRWCFPVAGCISYRGYFDEAAARAYADKLRTRGQDVAVRGVSAYSTLGYFDDPVLNTMMHWDDVQLIAIIFHELAHQLFYVKGDTAFNESFASVVEQEGLRRWTLHSGTATDLAGYEARRTSERCFQALISAARTQLDALYNAGGDPAALRAAKSEVFTNLLAEYRRAEFRGAITDAYEAWFGQGLNNAHVVAVGAYQQWIPALGELLARSGGDLNRFYRAAGRLGELSAADREEALLELDPAREPATCRAASG